MFIYDKKVTFITTFYTHNFQLYGVLCKYNVILFDGA